MKPHEPYQYPIIPYPGEQFCPVAEPNNHYPGLICSEPTVGRNPEGFMVCKHHLNGTRKRPRHRTYPFKKKGEYLK